MKPFLSIIIPAYNEANRIGITLVSVHDYLSGQSYRYEIIVVDDGSSDETALLVTDFAQRIPHLRVIRYAKNAGKGYAVRFGMLEATGKYRLFMDADNSVTIDAIEDFFDQIEKGHHVVIASIALQESNVVDQTSGYRQFLRKFSKKLIRFALTPGVYDTQRGFKLFSAHAADIIFSKQKVIRFGFDIELIVIAQIHDLSIVEVPVQWNNPAGSKVKFATYLHVLGDFVRIFLRKIVYGYHHTIDSQITHFDAKTEKKKGKGFTYKDREYVHHSDLHHTQTALYNLVHAQKVFLVSVATGIILALVFNWHLTLVVLISTLTIVYFIDLLFNALLIYRSFTRTPEISIQRDALTGIAESALPIYTIFCPLYKEWQVVPQFIKAMDALDYPKEKLQIMFLLEENDQETVEKIRAYNLPPHYEIVVVPDSKPKTKPKAMNYGLPLVRGEYLVIYDAEDVPESDQLKKAVLGFKEVPPHVVCMQAKLNFYNPRQNILTRVFTLEYSLWFDLVLPGLQSLNAPIPLGGTSNHFKVSALRELKGWDAFNVTEDADLGMRLAKQGYRTAILESTTYEEANSGLINWYNQRSRWIKGYIQTYFVHTRSEHYNTDLNSLKDKVIFHLNVGGKILSMFINPFMWLLTLCYFLFRAQIGGFIESLFPGPILYIGVFSLLFGNFIYLYYYMIGSMKRGYYGLVKYAFLVPLYWLGMSVASWKALYEVIVKPHYWSKTVHGLHLQKESTAKVEAFETIQPTEEPPVYIFSKLRKAVFSSGGILVMSTMFANVFNLVFNFYLGNKLSLEDFGVVTALNTIVYLLGMFINATGSTVTHQVAYLSGKNGLLSSFSFFKRTKARVLFPIFLIGALWLFIVPILASYLHIPNIWLVAAFSPAIIAAFFGGINRGYLQGSLLFKSIAGIVVIEVIVKLALAVGFVKTGESTLVALALPLSMLVAFGVSALMVAKRPKEIEGETLIAKPATFSFTFYSASLLNGFATTIFLSLDVFLAKHYLTASDAGAYSLLSLVGKMIFFFGSLLNIFILPFISRAEGEGTDSKKVFSRILLGTIGCTLLASLGLVLVGPHVLPLFFGSKITVIFPYIPLFALNMFLLAITNNLVISNIARKRYLFSGISIISAVFMIFNIARLHDSITQIVHALLLSIIVYASLIILAHLFYGKLVAFYRNIVDVLRIVSPLPPATMPKSGKKRILIFNWRCMKHAFAGGAELYIETMARDWVKAGHSVTLFCGNDRKNSSNEYVEGVRIIRRGGFYTVYVAAMLYYLFKFRGKFDTIVDCENGIPFFTPLYAKEPVTILVHHIHQNVFRKHLPRPLALLASFMEETMMPRIYRHARYIAASASTKTDMETIGIDPDSITVINPGADIDALVPGEKSDVPLVSFVGRLKEYKHVDVLIDAWVHVVAAVPDAKLIIAGTGDQEAHLKKQVHARSIGTSVLFAGRVSEEVKRELYQSSWVCVNPSMMEGWGITSIEANACGTPMIASDVPGLHDSVLDTVTGYLFPYGDSATLAECIIKVLTKPRTRAKLAKQALEWSKEFGWQQVSERFLKKII